MIRKLMLSISAICSLYGCSKVDDNFKNMVVPSGVLYTAKTDQLTTWSGRERMMLTWRRGPDTKIKNAIVYWNTGKDSMTFDVPAAPSTDSVFVVIPKLPESSYSFTVITRDGNGHRSVPTSILGNTYGPVYEGSLQPRVVKSSKAIGADFCVYWYKSNDATNVNTRLNFTDLAGVLQTVDNPGDPDSILLKNVKKGTFCKFRTMFKPTVTAIDTFYSRVDSVKIP
ncbi:protein of unknown function [Chitinophaga jiangningensis]|uniref:DUF4998 domain-containing protein n=1 Tax=Chitinophaga jiangningensis TaxID=1419482 RepID=A0A1M7LUC5_9BACT|nr:DUF4998 domain-containing protein [Chitinophaga jiangningensis]SHM81926.1 protein of unknown function [Chitinophaga jiangningensis]